MSPPPTAGSSTALFDLQVNGFAGVDFQSPGLTFAALEVALQALAARRTEILLTLMTDRIDAICAKLARVEAMRRDSRFGGVVAGYHLEGPYLSAAPGFFGAHARELMKAPEIGEFDCMWQASGGNVRLITLAPELPGAVGFIRHVVAHGVRVSIGHSDASHREIDAAVAAGLSLCTHLGNAAPIQLHRHDNIIQRLLARDELCAAFIPDGIHVPPATLRNFVRAKPREQVIFTTDCMAAAGAPPGRYPIGRLEVDVGADGVVREPGKENFAGSSLTMDAAFANAQRFLGWSHDEALAACSSRVRAALGLPAAGWVSCSGATSEQTAGFLR